MLSMIVAETFFYNVETALLDRCGELETVIVSSRGWWESLGVVYQCGFIGGLGEGRVRLFMEY